MRLRLASCVALLILFFCSALVWGLPVTIAGAEDVADAFIGYEQEKSDVYRAALGISADTSLYGAKILTDGVSPRTLAYVFELDPSGYIVVTADTQIVPIIAYSFTGTFSWEESTENILLDMLRQDMANRLRAVQDGQMDAGVAADNEQSWEEYLGLRALDRETYEVGVYGPWTLNPWSQGAPYNNDCPMDPNTWDRCIVGCVATALAQILNYWQYPTSVTFQASDNYTSTYDPGDENGARTIPIVATTANFYGLDYNDSNPSDAAKATLSFAAGVSVWMKYSSVASGAGQSNVAAALAGSSTPYSAPAEQWGYYSADLRAYNETYSWWGSPYYITQAAFFDDLKSNMMQARPAQMAITRDISSGGHSILVDGYSPTSDDYHLNYGWGSSSYGWYSLPTGMPSSYDIVRSAIYNIIPTTLTYTMSTSTSGTGTGTVQALPGTGALTRGTHVLVNATPAPGSSFSHWTGDLSGSDNPAMLILDGNKSATAVFDGGSGPVVVNFPDPGLEAAIRDEIEKPTGDIYDTDLIGLVELDASNRSIANLEGIQHCTDLTWLYLWDNEIIDISPLASLTNLLGLDLWGNQIVDISPLSGLTNLTWLYLWDNPIIDISPLASLTNLQALALGGSLPESVDSRSVSFQERSGLYQIHDIRLPSKFPLPGRAKSGRSQLSDISPLSGLTNLGGLALLNAQIIDISPLDNLTNLEWLYLNDNQVVDITPLGGLTNLEYLELDENQIVDIASLVNNAGIGNGDWVSVEWNSLCLSPGSPDQLDVDVLLARGVDVTYDNQTCIDTVIINFPDPGLEAAIRDVIGKPTGDILDTDLVGLVELDAGHRNIANLEGIQYCIDLVFLWLHYNQIVDISLLSNLTNLTHLSVSTNQIVDISALSGLTNLTFPNLGINQIVDISPLASLTNLTRLDLYYNQIVDISPLVNNSGISGGDEVHITYNHLCLYPGSEDMENIEALLSRGVDVSYDNQTCIDTVVVNFPDPGLEAAIREAIVKPTGDIYESDLVGLVELDARSRDIVNLEGIQHCDDLMSLFLYNNQIVDISWLSGLTSLTVLSLQANEIVNISPVSSLTNLTWLSLSMNEIVDISPLAGLTNLTVVYLHSNQIIDISPISVLTNLARLYLYSNQIIDISPISGLTNLTYLSLYNNLITDIRALAFLTNLEVLVLSGMLRSPTGSREERSDFYQINDEHWPSELAPLNQTKSSRSQLSDISPLRGLTNLRVLAVWDAHIVDIAPLSGLTDLTELRLNSNQIIDISPLDGLANLEILYLNDNQIVDIAPLVSNAGISSGDEVDVRSNHLCLSPGSEDMANIDALLARGVAVEYGDQTCVDTTCWSDGVVEISISGSGTDSVAFGVSPDAIDGIDYVNDVPNPPPPFAPYVDGWFTIDGDKFGTDIKAPIACEEIKSWTMMRISDDGGSSQVTLRWDLSGVHFGSCLSSITLTDLTSGTSIDMRASSGYTYAKASDPETRTFEIVVNCTSCGEECIDLSDTGWQMITLPGALCGECSTPYGDLCCALGDDVNPLFIFRYDPTVGGYVAVPPCDAVDYTPGMGMWINVIEPATACVPTQVLSEPVIIPLGDGWNQVGNPFMFPVLLSSARIRYQEQEVTLAVAQANGWVSQYLFGYDSGIGGYETVMPPEGVLQALGAYWVLTHVECELWIPNAPAPPVLPQRPQRANLSALRAQGIETPPPPPAEMSVNHDSVLAGLDVGNYPNPVRSKHTTTFKVQGAGAEQVEAIVLRIYDLSGVLVYEQEVASTELDWHTDNSAGELLSNGTYLYQILVKIGDVWHTTGIQKVVVLR